MDEPLLKDLSCRLASDEVQELLSEFEYPPEVRERKTDKIVSEYRQKPQQLHLGAEVQGELVGLIGLALDPPGTAVIRHIVVCRDHRRSGIGRAMIEAVRRKYSLQHICAETDRDAVAVYRKCGFEIRGLGEKYPGTERFWCTLRGPVQQGPPADRARRAGKGPGGQEERQ